MDREKVLKELEELCEYFFHEYKTGFPEDAEDTYNRFLTANNALNMLKGQDHGWISVKDKMPPNDPNIKVLTYGSPVVTHWMPLPEPPEEQQETIVRCKDCRHWDTYNVECTKSHNPVPPYGCWFCADGERENG